MALAIIVSLMLVAFVFGRVASGAAPVAQSQPALTRTTIQPGETLWDLATRLAPGQDPRELVAQLRRLNGMPSAELQAGQQLLLPAVAA